ncbi:MAG: trimethylamine methyltransferase family protein [Phycisphaerales bacterium]|nr:MAG: trimethylamine methyltransferase family protein [Phycisphaerales bacterium]
MLTKEGIIPIRGGQYKILSEHQIQALHDATAEVLQKVGLKVMHEEALELLRSNGCNVDFERQVAKIPEEVLMKYVGMAPSKVPHYGRDAKYDLILDDSDSVYVMGGAGAVHYLDMEGERRESTMRALEDFTRLEDTLEYMDIAHFLLTPQDIEQKGHEMLLFAHMLKNNTRNFYALPGGCRKGLEFQIEMAAVCAGSVEEVSKRPFFTAGLCILSPLTHRRDFVEELWACGDYNIPAYVEADAMAGGTTPFTIAGCIVEVNANVLAAIALAQMKNPGAPCVYSSSSGILDMRTLNFAGCAPESTLLHMASCQMAHHYHLPYYGTNTPDSKLPDAQMGYERAQHFLGCALAGVNIIHVAIGNLEMMRLASFEQCLIDNEILGATFRFVQGIDCRREAIGLDAFEEVRHSSRFLECQHTLNFVRSRERWEPKLTDRNSWNSWMERTGGKDMRERARAMASDILKTHHPKYASDRQAEEIDRIAMEAQKYFVNGGTQ